MQDQGPGQDRQQDRAPRSGGAVGERARGALAPGALTRVRGRGARPARDLEYAVLDLETTGLDPEQGARIVEVAVVRMRGDGTVLREFTTLVDPRAPVTGQEFHGVTGGDTVGAPRSGDLAAALTALFSGAVVVGHNLDFEAAFLSSELVPAGLAARLPGLCTLRTLRSQVELDRYSLPHASRALNGHWPTGRHTAMGDARACARLLAEMLDAAPGELFYTGPEPRTLPVPEGSRPFRHKPRTGPKGGLGALGDLWPPVWRRWELSADLCGGAFDASARRSAVRDANGRELRREAVAGAAALAGALAATSAARSLLLRARALR